MALHSARPFRNESIVMKTENVMERLIGIFPIGRIVLVHVPVDWLFVKHQVAPAIPIAKRKPRRRGLIHDQLILFPLMRFNSRLDPANSSRIYLGHNGPCAAVFNVTTAFSWTPFTCAVIGVFIRATSPPSTFKCIFTGSPRANERGTTNIAAVANDRKICIMLRLLPIICRHREEPVVNRSFILCLLLIATRTMAVPTEAADSPPNAPLPTTAPVPFLSAEDAIKTMKLAPGFHMEVVACEPMVEHPVAMAFDPDGRIWVVEMRSYMPTSKERKKERRREGFRSSKTPTATAVWIKARSLWITWFFRVRSRSSGWRARGRTA